MMFENELQEFEKICKKYTKKPSKRLDKTIRRKYMDIYYLIRAFEEIYDLINDRNELRRIVRENGIK